MNYWDKNPIFYQIFISILSFCFVLLGTFYFVKLATSISDENIFVSPPSELYISSLINTTDEDKFKLYDSVFVGNFIIGLDDILLDTVNKPFELLETTNLILNFDCFFNEC